MKRLLAVCALALMGALIPVASASANSPESATCTITETAAGTYTVVVSGMATHANVSYDSIVTDANGAGVGGHAGLAGVSSYTFSGSVPTPGVYTNTIYVFNDQGSGRIGNSCSQSVG